MKKHNNEETVSCPECECDVTVWFYPGEKGNTYGPPEDCYPSFAATLDMPDKCHRCGTEFTADDEERWLEQIGEMYSENPEKEFDKYEHDYEKDWY
jgi:hypothetical protein